MSTLSERLGLSAEFTIPRVLQPALAQLLRVSCPKELEDLDLGPRSAREAELFLRSLTPAIQYGFLFALSALEVSALVRPSSRGRRFSQLDGERAKIHFDTWWNLGGLPHAMAKALKATVIMGFYETQEMRARLGYEPDGWIAKVAQRRMQSYAAEIQRHEKELLERRPLPLGPEAAAMLGGES